MMDNNKNEDRQDKNLTMNDAPPFFRSWNKIYGLVLAVLALMIILFYWFSISFK